MKTLLFEALFTLCLSLNASLTLLSYDPLLFRLNFTSPVQKPRFQLLYNNIYNIPYTFLTQEQTSTHYLLQAQINELPSTSSIEVYGILFNSPLTVGEGQLEVQRYTLQAKKSEVQIGFPIGWGIFILIAAYFFNTLTEIGKLSIQFIHIYILYMFQSKMVTNLYHQLYVGMLLLPPSQILQQQDFSHKNYTLICLALPMALLVITGLIGFIVFKLARFKQRSILQNIVYQQFVFNAFLKVMHIFFFNLSYNSLQFISYLQNNTVNFLQSIKGIGLTLVYFNFTMLIAILYLILYVMNPKIGQKSEDWQRYLQSQQFLNFRNIHDRILLKNWYRRNYSLMKMAKYLILSGLFFAGNSFQYTVLLFQFMHLFYTFTVRPFKQEFYLNIKMICRLLFFAEYLIIVLGVLYFSITPVTYNYYFAQKFVVARDSVFIVVIIVLFIIVFFEIYFICDNLKYRIRLVREASQYKLQFVRKAGTDSDSKGHKNKAKGFMTSEKSKQQSKPPQYLSELVASPEKSQKKQLKPIQQELTRGKSKTNVQVKMKQQHQSNYHRKNSSALQWKYQSNKARVKWKKDSLLFQAADRK